MPVCQLLSDLCRAMCYEEQTALIGSSRQDNRRCLIQMQEFNVYRYIKPSV